MKNLITVLALTFTTFLFAQKAQFKAILKGKIEIDGHIYTNKVIFYEADFKGIKIYDKENEYVNRSCKKDSCKIIHLEKINKYSGNLLLQNLTN